jgi:hypothetical protein
MMAAGDPAVPRLGSGAPAGAEVVKDIVNFVDLKGSGIVTFTTNRTSCSSYDLHFAQSKVNAPEDHLGNYLYLNPPNYKWITSDAHSDKPGIIGGKGYGSLPVTSACGSPRRSDRT